jgi:hypothetical protein
MTDDGLPAPDADADPTTPDASVLPDRPGHDKTSGLTAAEQFEHGRS